MPASQVAAPAGLNVVRRLPAKQRLNLAIALKLRNQEELQGLLEALYNPADPRYRHYLSVAEFTDRFGPTVGDHEKVLAFLRAHGLEVTHTAVNRMVVDASGTVEDIERSFGVKMYVYQHPVEARTFYAPDVEPSVDASLPIQGVAGLSTLNLPHPASALARLAANAQPQATGSGLYGSYTAGDLRAAYIPGVTLGGAGQAIGLFEMNGYRVGDIQDYFSSMGQSLSVPLVNVLLDGENGTCGTSCDDSEQALDIEMALALAPDLSAVIVYEGSTPVDILNQMAGDDLAKQLSCSYVFEADPALYEPVFKEFAAQGQSFVASSGDGGAYSPPGCSSGCWKSLFPADDPYVTAVGGTELTTNGPGGAWQSETAWPGSGGGINSYGYPIATYQVPLVNGLNQGSSTLRNIPDVAAIAFNVFVRADGSPGSLGGTSAAAPVWASFLALVNQQANGTSVGFLNPTVYGLAQSSGYGNYFHDITTGNNFDSYSPGLFAAVTGYDLVTGLGSPNGQNLINALAGVNSGANFALVPSSPTLPVEQGAQGSVGITLEPSNGFNGTVALSAVLVGQHAGVTATLSQTSISASAGSTLTVSTTSAASIANLVISITGKAGGLTQTLYVPVTVLLPNLVETAVSPSPGSIVPGGTFPVTDTVENTGQAPAGSSVTQYYLSATGSKSGVTYLLGNRPVPALAAGASSTGTVTVTVPANIWPDTPYYLLACANDTNTVPGAAAGNCIASASAKAYTVAQTPTTTSLTMTSSGSPVTSVSSGTVVTLTATVQAGSTSVNPGQVNFCDASTTYCEDIHRLGSAQLTANGTATFRFIPGIGEHSYKAVFSGTVGYAASSSGSSVLHVSGTHPTTSGLTESGAMGNYSLTATVTGVGGAAPLSGNISFLDTSNGGASLGSQPLVAGPHNIGWLKSQTPATGADPQGIASADFNGDGIPDLAVTNRNDGTVTILLGNGDGTYKQAPLISNVVSAQAIVATDFNGDGIPDLAVTNSGWDTVTILLGKGDGTFTPAPATLNTDVLPAALAAADLNGDGIADLVVVNYIGNSITVFLGKGNGAFTALPAIEIGGAPQGVAAADFNGDGKLDLAVAVASPSNEMVEVLLGNGDGTFTPSGATLTVGAYPSAIVSADFNGDGKPDLAVTIAYSNELAIFLGNGNGTFTAAPANPATGNYPLSLATADFNGDGKPDLAVANNGGSTLTMLLGNGDGTFTAASTNAVPGNSPVSIVAADFNGDGVLDLATANELDDTASIFLTQLTQMASATVSGVNPAGPGSHLVEASYPGDLNYTASLSATVSLSSAAVTPTVMVTPSSPSITATQSLTVTVTVNGAPTPTGTVTLSSGSYSSGAMALAAGSATFNIPAGALASGSDTLAASYSPDTNSSAIYHSAAGTSSVTVTAVPVVSISAIAAFGAEPLGTTSAGQSVTVTNTGSANLTFTAISVTGPFAVTPSGTTCSISNPVAASHACTVVITFTPTAAGSVSGSLSLTDNGPASPQSATLTGTAIQPSAHLSVTSLSFGSVAVGAASAAQQVTITNTGTAVLAISSIALTGTNANQFAETNTCPASLNAGATCGVSVSFKPTAAGNMSASVSIVDNAPGSPQGVTLTGTAAQSGANLSVTSLSFGSVAVGAASAAQQVTITNTGTAVLAISSIALSGTNANQFAETNTCPASLNVGATCGVSVSFKPTAAGSMSASVSIVDNAPGSPQSVTLTGTGAQSGASLSVTSLSFGSVAVGATSAAQQVTITNNGTMALAISSITISGTNANQFAETNNCPGSLNAGAACNLSVSFKPTATGSKSASVSIGDSAPGSPQTVTLSGTAAQPSANLSVTSLSFGSVAVGASSTAQQVTITNTGTVALAISSVTINGTNANQFAETNNCPGSLNAGGTCNLSVSFKPTATGSKSASVSIVDNATGSPQSVALTGTAVQPSAHLSVTSLNFGSVAVGTSSAAQQVTITNTGTVALPISSIALSGTNANQFSQTNTCPASLNAGAGCSISVRFRPTSTGNKSGALTVSSATALPLESVSLNGTAH